MWDLICNCWEVLTHVAYGLFDSTGRALSYVYIKFTSFFDESFNNGSKDAPKNDDIVQKDPMVKRAEVSPFKDKSPALIVDKDAEEHGYMPVAVIDQSDVDASNSMAAESSVWWESDMANTPWPDDESFIATSFSFNLKKIDPKHFRIVKRPPAFTRLTTFLKCFKTRAIFFSNLEKNIEALRFLLSRGNLRADISVNYQSLFFSYIAPGCQKIQELIHSSGKPLEFFLVRAFQAANIGSDNFSPDSLNIIIESFISLVLHYNKNNKVNLSVLELKAMKYVLLISFRLYFFLIENAPITVGLLPLKISPYMLELLCAFMRVAATRIKKK